MTEGLCRARAERRGIVSVPASSEPDRAKPDPDKQQCCYDPDCPDVGHRIGERKVRQNRDRRIRSQVLPDRVVLHGTTAPNVTLPHGASTASGGSVPAAAAERAPALCPPMGNKPGVSLRPLPRPTQRAACRHITFREADAENGRYDEHHGVMRLPFVRDLAPDAIKCSGAQ